MTTIAARWRERTDDGTAISWPSELASLAVTAATAFALARAFRSWDELWKLLGVVTIAHAWCVAARWARLGAVAAFAVGLALGTVVVGLAYYGDVTVWGVPTADTLGAVASDIREAFGPFDEIVPPVDALRGFTIVFAAGLWLMVLFADLAGHRSAAPMQAVVAPIATFVVSSILLLGRHALAASALMVAALALYRLAVRARAVRDAGSSVPAASATGATAAAGGRAVWSVGLTMLVTVLTGGIVLNGMAPAPADGFVDLRAVGRGAESRVVESPLVSLDAMLGDRSDEVLFTVTSATAEPHYWRLTSLDDFDGRSWSASARYRDLDSGEAIESPWAPGVDVQEQTFVVGVEGLRSDWLPAPFAPVSVSTDAALRHEPTSSSVFVADDATTQGIDYSVRSLLARPDAALLSTVEGTARASHVDELALPAPLSDEVRALALAITDGRSPFEQARALEEFFLGEGPYAADARFDFRYDLTASYRDQADPLEAFIFDGRGFCQQFATAFAAMARVARIPARVAVGFTYGDARSRADGTTTWTVRGRHAHAWPEVFLDGVGWVAFEPTPGRGNPDATGYSNQPAAQADASGDSVELGTTTTTTTTTIVPGQAAVPTSQPSTTSAPTEPAPTEREPLSTAPLVTMGVVVALLALAGLVVVARRHWVRRRRTAARAGGDTTRRVALSWQQTCHDLERVGIVRRPSETPLEFGRRAARMLEVRELATLGRHESDRRFRAVAPGDDDAANAEEISDEVRDVVWSRLDRTQRWRAELDV